jgi:hypothetical protein
VEAVGQGISYAVSGASKGGGWLYGAASGLFRRNPAASATEKAASGVPVDREQAGKSDSIAEA